MDRSVTSLLVTHLRTAVTVVRTPRSRTITTETNANERTDLRIALEMRPDATGHRRCTALLLTGMKPIVFVKFLLEEDDARIAARRQSNDDNQKEHNEQHVALSDSEFSPVMSTAKTMNDLGAATPAFHVDKVCSRRSRLLNKPRNSSPPSDQIMSVIESLRGERRSHWERSCSRRFL